MPLEVTIAVKLPPARGFVENVTVSEVAEAEVTVPTALLLRTTVLLAGVGSKPKPLIVTVVIFAAALAVLLVTTGITVATSTALPLVTEFVVTITVKLPAVVGAVVSVTVSSVSVAAVTVPAAPLLNTTVLLAAVVSNPDPVIVMEDAFAGRSSLLLVTTGAIRATCTAVPLLMVLVVTTAVRIPAAVGFVSKLTVNELLVAAVTVPAAPLSNTTVLFAAVESKPNP